MRRMSIGSHDPSTVTLCFYCGAACFDPIPEGYAHQVCDACDTANVYSDWYKEIYGVRPRHPITLKEMKSWIAAHAAGGQS